MTLDDLVEDKGGTVDNEREFKIERLDRDRGFMIRVDFEVPGEENGKYMDTFLSPHVEGRVWQRQDLTNDVVEEAVNNIIDNAQEELEDAKFDGARVREVTRVREVELKE